MFDNLDTLMKNPDTDLVQGKYLMGLSFVTIRGPSVWGSKALCIHNKRQSIKAPFGALPLSVLFCQYYFAHDSPLKAMSKYRTHYGIKLKATIKQFVLHMQKHSSPLRFYKGFTNLIERTSRFRHFYLARRAQIRT